MDDEQLIRWSLKEGLSEAGFDVRVAADGAEARSLFNGHVAAAILDIRLPDADGLDLLTEFRNHRPKLPVIIISAHATRSTEDEAKARGAFALVHKPFDVDELAEIVRQALDGSSE